jgi:hypothetical protein
VRFLLELWWSGIPDKISLAKMFLEEARCYAAWLMKGTARDVVCACNCRLLFLPFVSSFSTAVPRAATLAASTIATDRPSQTLRPGPRPRVASFTVWPPFAHVLVHLLCSFVTSSAGFDLLLWHPLEGMRLMLVYLKQATRAPSVRTRRLDRLIFLYGCRR